MGRPKIIRELQTKPLLVLGDSWIREGDPKSVGFAVRVGARLNTTRPASDRLLPIPLIGLGGVRGLLTQTGAVLQIPKGGMAILVLGIDDARGDTPLKGWADATMLLIELLASRVYRLMIVVPCFAPEISEAVDRSIGAAERRWLRRAVNVLRQRLDEVFPGHSQEGSVILLRALEGVLEDFKDQIWPTQSGYEYIATEIAIFLSQE